VVISRDVVFDEMAAWDWVQQGAGEAGGVSSTFTIEHLVMQGGGVAGAQTAAATVGEQAAADDLVEGTNHHVVFMGSQK
jgi:hypothetical protein